MLALSVSKGHDDLIGDESTKHMVMLNPSTALRVNSVKHLDE